ncbi:bleomycin resistance protein [Sphingomonas alpina]|uniref:Bleomycin resistance protein n=1 Tax=Sphingomonas alpina TaxID=653931 RepID=A0A7H0LP78_9SPHN|nr:VOC family protein [Sphingomonas alpina]QNQ11481.1 VOC family protein [Sphingomonas alpina]
MIEMPGLVPELDVISLEASLAIYRGVLGFELLAERPDEGFAYLGRGRAHLMLQQADGPGRRFRTAPLEKPYGRGINLQMEIDDADALYRRVVDAGLTIVLALEERWYQQGAMSRGQRQFVVSDPDGYLLRFFSTLGTRDA